MEIKEPINTILTAENILNGKDEVTEMKKKLLCVLMSMVMLGSMAALPACGGGEDSSRDADQQATVERVEAADPMTDEEMENDDSEGCIEDSEDLLY